MVKLEPSVQRGAELLEMGAFEVVPRNCLLPLGELGFDALGVKVMVAEQTHGQSFRCGADVYVARGGLGRGEWLGLSAKLGCSPRGMCTGSYQ